MAEENKDNQPGAPEVITEVGSSKLSDLWRMEDYWAIWLGFLLIVVALCTFLPRSPAGMQKTIDDNNAKLTAEAAAPYHTVAWFQANDAKAKIKATSEGYANTIKTWTSKPHGWKSNPLDAFVFSKEKEAAKKAGAEEKAKAAKDKADALLDTAKAADETAKAAGYKDDALNEKADAAITAWRKAHLEHSAAASKAKKVKSYNQLPYLIGLGLLLAVFFGIGMQVMGHSIAKFIPAFLGVFGIAILAYLFEAQATMKEFGIGYAAWAILFGLLISNTIGTPKWMKAAVQTEYFIKTGLVLLGCEILFGKILLIGLPGIFVAWIVTPIVLISTYLFGQWILKIPSKTLNITISADMSVCGVSAAIATAAACRAKKEELTLAVGMSLVFTSIMMIVMPWFIKLTGMPHVLGGAWMGGTIDATGAVAAAGEFLSERAMYVAATIKMIQNVLIGVVAFCVAFYWCAKVDRREGQRVGALEIWHRFPKFVIGFISASILMSLIYQALGPDAGYTMIDNGLIRGFTTIFRGWFFCLAFVSIGLATDFRQLKQYFAGGKPLILYVCGQTLNLILTLGMAYLMFYIVFKEITDKI